MRDAALVRRVTLQSLLLAACICATYLPQACYLLFIVNSPWVSTVNNRLVPVAGLSVSLNHCLVMAWPRRLPL